MDEIVPIEDAAPDGLRFPTDAEIEAVRAQGVDLVETDVDDWRDDLAPHLADHRRQATPILATTTFIALTLGFAALLVPLNEYDAMGIEGAYDCDGPLEVGLFLVPALLSCVVTLVSAVIVLRRAERTSTVVPTCGALVLLLLTLLVPKAVRLYQESERNSAPGSPCS